MGERRAGKSPAEVGGLKGPGYLGSLLFALYFPFRPLFLEPPGPPPPGGGTPNSGWMGPGPTPPHLLHLKRSPYLAINPAGKVPALVLPDGDTIPESEVRPSSELQ